MRWTVIPLLDFPCTNYSWLICVAVKCLFMLKTSLTKTVAHYGFSQLKRRVDIECPTTCLYKLGQAAQDRLFQRIYSKTAWTNETQSSMIHDDMIVMFSYFYFAACAYDGATYVYNQQFVGSDGCSQCFCGAEGRVSCDNTPCRMYSVSLSWA